MAHLLPKKPTISALYHTPMLQYWTWILGRLVSSTSEVEILSWSQTQQSTTLVLPLLQPHLSLLSAKKGVIKKIMKIQTIGGTSAWWRTESQLLGQELEDRWINPFHNVQWKYIIFGKLLKSCVEYFLFSYGTFECLISRLTQTNWSLKLLIYWKKMLTSKGSKRRWHCIYVMGFFEVSKRGRYNWGLRIWHLWLGFGLLFCSYWQLHFSYQKKII